MKTWTIVLQTDLAKEELYDKIVKMREQLKIRGFYIENYDEPNPQPPIGTPTQEAPQ